MLLVPKVIGQQCVSPKRTRGQQEHAKGIQHKAKFPVSKKGGRIRLETGLNEPILKLVWTCLSRLVRKKERLFYAHSCAKLIALKGQLHRSCIFHINLRILIGLSCVYCKISKQNKDSPCGSTSITYSYQIPEFTKCFPFI